MPRTFLAAITNTAHQEANLLCAMLTKTSSASAAGLTQNPFTLLKAASHSFGEVLDLDGLRYGLG